MALRLIHLYPDLMSLYGSYANISVLRRCLEAESNSSELETVRLGEPLDLAGGDFLYMGAGTERASLAALEALRPYAGALKKALESGMTMLFAGTAMELLGEQITEADGTLHAGLGLVSFTVTRGEKRIVGDVYGRTTLFPEPVVGFMNKCAAFTGIGTPLLMEVKMGPGNAGPETPEGFCWKNLFASELTGPILVKNPRLLELIARRICDRAKLPWPVPDPCDSWAKQGYHVTEAQLRGLIGKK